MLSSINKNSNINLKFNIKMPDNLYSNLNSDYKCFLSNNNLSQIKKCLDFLDQYYYEGNPIVTDKVYDIISDYYYSNSTDEKSSKIGYNINHGSKVKLPIACTSLDKVKPGQSKLTSFLKNYTNDKCISSKLDGNSLLIGVIDSIPVAYTRGNGVHGTDVSHILKHTYTC